MDGRSMLEDTDLYCLYPYLQSVNCAQASAYFSFEAPLFLRGCHRSNSSAPLLMQERCLWECKHDRPIIRCLREFDPLGHYGMATSRLQRCWLQDECADGSRASSNLRIACRPVSLVNATVEVQRLRASLEAALQAHQAAQDHIEELLAAQNETDMLLGNETPAELHARAAALEERLQEAREASIMSAARLAGVAAELNATRTLLFSEGSQHNVALAALEALQLQAAQQIDQALHAQRLFLQRKQGEWNAERDKLLESEGRLKTELEEERAAKGSTGLFVALLVALVLLLVCAMLVVYLCARQKRLQRIVWDQAEAHAQGMGSQVVLGRPVDGSSAQTHEASLTKPASASLPDPMAALRQAAALQQPAAVSPEGPPIRREFLPAPLTLDGSEDVESPASVSPPSVTQAHGLRPARSQQSLS